MLVWDICLLCFLAMGWESGFNWDGWDKGLVSHDNRNTPRNTFSLGIFLSEEILRMYLPTGYLYIDVHLFIKIFQAIEEKKISTGYTHQ